jgi:hypothetical protein
LMIGPMMSATNFISKEYIGEMGYYGISFLQGYTYTYVLTNSFFVAFFRYLCIVQTDLLQSIGVAPKVA